MAGRGGSVIVVGGGIIGIACAHYLSRAGFRVNVIDQSGIGKACSHANCGYLCPSHVLPLNEPGAVTKGIRSLFDPCAAFRIKPQLRLGFAEWMLQFASRCTHEKMIAAGGHLSALLDLSADEYRALFAEIDLDCERNEKGLLYVFESAAGFDTYAETDKMLTEHYGLTAKRIEGDALPELEPALKDGLGGAFLYEKDSSLRPDALVSNWHAYLQGEGVQFTEDCRLERVRRNKSGIAALETSKGELRADHYVFAAGAWSGKLAAELGCKLPVEPGKGYSLTMSQPENCPSLPMLFVEHHVGVTPFADRYRIGSMMEFVGFDSSIPRRRIRQLRKSAEPYLHTPTGSEVLETWYGWRPMTWDTLPVIGRVPGIDNSLFATGHNMLGLTLAPATGRLVADLVQERSTPINIDAFSPDRF